MSARLQLSILFNDDEKLFDNFIIPYKNEKMINTIIKKCLSAYYYHEDVRDLIESKTGFTLEKSDDTDTSDTQSLVDGIRASLIMQDFLASELQNTIEAGTEDVSNILNRTNDVAEQTGVAKTTTTEYGASVLKIEQHNLDLPKPQPNTFDSSKEVTTGDSISESDIPSELIDKIKEQAKAEVLKDLVKVKIPVGTGNNICYVTKDVANELRAKVGQQPTQTEEPQVFQTSSGVVKEYATVQEMEHDKAMQTARENKAYKGRCNYNPSDEACVIPAEVMNKVHDAERKLNEAVDNYKKVMVEFNESAV